jgi:GT2 family glycosyltransferase
VVVVTHNRAELLETMLAGLGRLDPAPDAVVVVDNASTDRTPHVLAEARRRETVPGLQVVRSAENLGGAGGFRLAVETAYEQGFDRIWLMDDDVVPAPDCLGVLLDQDADCLIAVREDADGRLVEKAGTRFDLRNPFVPNPKRATVESRYGTRAAMPALAEVETIAFEGFMVRRRVVEAIGLPDDSYFLFYDDADYALRARRAGFRIWAVRDAVMVRQLDLPGERDYATEKSARELRNFFVVHFRYGENLLVRAKPYGLAAAGAARALVRGRWREIRNVVKALRAARGMR